MKVICIDDKNIISGKTKLLELGRDYTVSFFDEDLYEVFLDGQYYQFHKSRFIDISVIRNEKIDDILK